MRVRRRVLLALILVATAFAAVVAFLVASVMAQSRGVSTREWFTGTGFGDLLNALQQYDTCAKILRRELRDEVLKKAA